MCVSQIHWGVTGYVICFWPCDSLQWVLINTNYIALLASWNHHQYVETTNNCTFKRALSTYLALTCSDFVSCLPYIPRFLLIFIFVYNEASNTNIIPPFMQLLSTLLGYLHVPTTGLVLIALFHYICNQYSHMYVTTCHLACST